MIKKIKKVKPNSDIISKEIIFDMIYIVRGQKVMLDSDLAIVPASGILLEVLSIGIPAITGYYVTDQKNSALNFTTLGLTFSIGDFREDFEDDLIDILKSLTLKKAQKMVAIQKRTLRGSSKNLLDLFMEYKYLAN